MKFMFVVRGDPAASAGRNAADQEAIIASYRQWEAGLRESGHLVEAIHLTSDTCVVRAVPEGFSVNRSHRDGDQTTLSAVYLLEAEDRVAAENLLLDSPVLQAGETIEVIKVQA